MNPIINRHLVRSFKLMPPAANGTPADRRYTMTAVANWAALGFLPSADLMEAMSRLPLQQLNGFNNEAIELLRELKGAEYDYVPFYPGFPRTVMDMDYSDLFLNAIFHYLTDGAWRPDEEVVRGPLSLLDQADLKVIDLGSYDDYLAAVKDIISAKTVITPAQGEALEDFFEDALGSDVVSVIPEEIPIKENLVRVAILAHRYGKAPCVFGQFKTATDVLRLVCGYCNGDISLATPTVFRSIPRAFRKMALEMLDEIASAHPHQVVEEMQLRTGTWLRLGEALHPGEYSSRFPHIYSAFQALRSGKKVETYASKLEQALAAKDVDSALKLLSARPGVFARRLDQVLRMADDPWVVVHAFWSVAAEVPTPLLLQIREYFAHRSEETSSRVFFPKGDVSKVFCKEDVLPAIPGKVCQNIVAACGNALMANYMKREPLGNVYVSEAMRQYNIPTKMRTAAKALETVARGSRFVIPEDVKVIRPFIYWKNGQYRTDIDLSAVVFDGDYCEVATCSYYSLRGQGLTHSGDVVDAPHGASEFVDIDIDKVSKYGRYVAITINSFTQQPYCDLPICFGGWMLRRDPEGGEVYEPTTVKQRFDVAGKQTTDLVAIVDVVDRVVYWADIAFERMSTRSHMSCRPNNAATHLGGIAAVTKAVVEMKQASLYDLFVLNAKARGVLVDNPEDADIVFSDDDVATVRPTDVDVIMSQYL